MTGLIALTSGEYDITLTEQVFLTICRNWERHCLAHFGFGVFVVPSHFDKFYSAGTSILQNNFPIPPGPFKRVATLLVMSQMHRLFHFSPELTHDATERWHAKMTALLIPVTLAKLRVNLTPEASTPTWRRLESWAGYPSDHFKLELLQFLERIETHHWWDRTLHENGQTGAHADRIIDEETTRLINALTLIIEGCYYWNEQAQGAVNLRGNCKDFFDGSDAEFVKEFYYDYKMSGE